MLSLQETHGRCEERSGAQRSNHQSESSLLRPAKAGVFFLSQVPKKTLNQQGRAMRPFLIGDKNEYRNREQHP
jgi:hypothetical protein